MSPRYTPHSYVIWRGPSLIDGAPIVVAVTGCNLRSPVAWILPLRTTPAMLDHPIFASVTAGHYAHREPFALPGYVIAHGKREAVPSAVWAALDGFKAGTYATSDGFATSITRPGGSVVQVAAHPTREEGERWGGERVAYWNGVRATVAEWIKED